MTTPATTPQQIAQRVGEGLLSFPVTHFNQQYDFVEQPYRQHIAWILHHRPAALFAAGGTGEFFSLSLDEFSLVVAAAVMGQLLFADLGRVSGLGCAGNLGCVQQPRLDSTTSAQATGASAAEPLDLFSDRSGKFSS